MCRSVITPHEANRSLTHHFDQDFTGPARLSNSVAPTQSQGGGTHPSVMTSLTFNACIIFHGLSMP